METARYTYKQRKQIRKDRQRLFRVVEQFDFSGIIDDSPVQVSEGYVISDIETNELFACYIFRNLSDRYIRTLSVRLLLYSDMNIPYQKIYFDYSFDNASLGIREFEGEEHKFLRRTVYPKEIRPLEQFGNTAYIKLPESYFKKIELEILCVEYADGMRKKLDIVVNNKAKPIESLGEEHCYAFYRMNIYRQSETSHPTVNMPQNGDNVWLCCCGNKNRNSERECSLCGRDKDWQFSTLNEAALDEKVFELKHNNDVLLRNKENFKQFERELTDEENKKKINDYEKVIRNIAEMERKKEHDKKMIIPKILLFFGAVYLIIYILSQL